MNKKIKKILIANRSEIACRVIKAAKELNIKTVAIYSEIDKDSLHVKLADESILVGPAPANQSYLDQENVINAALKMGADAIHPGYGFLSENYEFNEKVREAGLTYIAPNIESMKLMGSKTASRKTMIEAGVPVIEGYQDNSSDVKAFKQKAIEIGFPVLVKASAGGGGKGMRIVRSEEEFEDAFASSSREAKNAFGDSTVFVEKYIENPRHIEFQVAGDKHGNYVHLFERECSIQRRHQKIIEETPSTALDNDLRNEMGEAAVNAVKAVDYDSVGTVEFLLDNSGNYYFLEVNTRIQVEHPITEMTTGIDLLKLQIKIAEGEELPFKQEELSQQGHSIECRVYAEDARKDFIPTGGIVLFHKAPEGLGVRYDTGIITGSEISSYYDPIMSKIISYGSTRTEAIERMKIALKDTVILGVVTSLDFIHDVLDTDDFRKGKTYTNFLENNSQLFEKDDDDYLFAASFLTAIESEEMNDNTDNMTRLPWEIIGEWEIGELK
ncbi:MAG: acetyl/propionyl/methylcrotonyl-CoA carboxylase subunit alpha [Chlorobiota bacterium]